VLCIVASKGDPSQTAYQTAFFWSVQVLRLAVSGDTTTLTIGLGAYP